jgi:cell wall-associated protease
MHAAGNASSDNDTVGFFPSATYLNSSTRASNFINVGSTSADTGYALASSYSNYGQMNVDLFAPGEFIYVPLPDNKYEFNSGTSFAAPVVAGIAALILEYYPKLTAVQLKEILMKSVTPLKGKMVYRPGSKVKVDFASLSVTGGIVNAYDALKLASTY